MGALPHLIIVVVIGMVFRLLWKSSLDEHASAEAGRTLFSPTRAIRFLAVFQIGYDTGRAQARTKQLRLHGYEVVSVVGNEAKLVLTLPQECDFFIVGHAAPEERRAEMVAWLKAKYPQIRILAVNGPQICELAGADFNVKLNGPEVWLPLIASIFQTPQQGPGPSDL